MNVYLPDELAGGGPPEGLNVSALTQEALKKGYASVSPTTHQRLARTVRVLTRPGEPRTVMEALTKKTAHKEELGAPQWLTGSGRSRCVGEVDLLIRAAAREAVANRIDGVTIHAPAHFDAEILSASAA